jgi:hypothetical protein
MLVAAIPPRSLEKACGTTSCRLDRSREFGGDQNSRWTFDRYTESGKRTMASPVLHWQEEHCRTGKKGLNVAAMTAPQQMASMKLNMDLHVGLLWNSELFLPISAPAFMPHMGCMLSDFLCSFTAWFINQSR